jgi:hypothetical protein
MQLIAMAQIKAVLFDCEYINRSNSNSNNMAVKGNQFEEAVILACVVVHRIMDEPWPS